MYGRDELQTVPGEMPGTGFPDGFPKTQATRRTSGEGLCQGSFSLKMQRVQRLRRFLPTRRDPGDNVKGYSRLGHVVSSRMTNVTRLIARSKRLFVLTQPAGKFWWNETKVAAYAFSLIDLLTRPASFSRQIPGLLQLLA